MSTYIFKKLKDKTNPYDTTEVEMIVETVDRQELLERFIDFLQVSGYNVKDLEDELGEEND